uniref:protein FAR1-RELATED SEQUENCE 5-like n=1 Tax=Erigeron canadensis TaxID=72917 RepID=UPI001CB94F8D|nr:protein FAR1-RELATED SEQUENCE 5-like [Erigeron canadensis]
MVRERAGVGRERGWLPELGEKECGSRRVFGSREELVDWVQKLAYSLGVVIVTKRSNPRPCGFVYRVVLKCQLGGKYQYKDSSKDTGTRKTNCPFELEGRYSDEYDCWILRVICDEHNHRPILFMEGHPYAKRLSADEFNYVADLTRMHVPPRNILSLLKKRNLSNASTPRTIYNARNKIRMVEYGEKSQMQVLMSLLHSNNYVYEFTTTESNELDNLFFVHPTSFDIWRAFPHVLIIDATYKTNPYNMPFVEIVGVTSTSNTFSIAFAFIHSEKTANYKWVLDCLKLTLDECMLPRVIVTDKEMALVNACNEVFPDATQLLCRVESQHAKLKIYMDKNAKCSLDRLLGCIDEIVKSQLTLIKESLENSRVVRIHKHNLRCFKLLRGFVSNEALKKVLEDRKRWKDKGDCGCRLRTAYGLPCQYITLDSIDIFWRKLDLSLSSTQKDDVSCDDVLQHFKENYNKQSKVGKKSWLRKLMNIFSPDTTDIREPRVQNKTRGRPKKSQQKKRTEFCSKRFSCSTMPDFVEPIREPARQNTFEFDLNKEPNIDLNEVPYEFQGPHMLDLNKAPLKCGSNLMDDIPQVFHPYITNIQNIFGDGNCGYRALAVGLGLNEDNFYEYIRQQMREELQNRYDLYSRIFVIDINSMYQDLCFCGSPCPPEHWMKMPEAGVLIANKLGVIVHSLDKRGSTTIFPFWCGPEDVEHHRALAIALVNG